MFKLIDDKQVYDSNEICQWIPKRSYCVLLEVLALLQRREYEETDTLPHYFGVLLIFPTIRGLDSICGAQGV